MEYTNAGLPWFSYYGGDKTAIDGAKALGKIKSIKDLAVEKREHIWNEDKLITAPVVKSAGSQKVNGGSL